MRDRSDTILVFTSETLGSLLSEGGSQAWKLSAPRAGQCTWLLCVRNRLLHAERGRQVGSEAHGAGFLLGRISSVVSPTQNDTPGRWKIAFGEFAHIHFPKLWDGGQNPVRYASLETLGIAPAHLPFRPIRLWNGWSGMPGPTGYRSTQHESAPLPPGMSLPGMPGERQRR
jgi:hypothetical protein